MSNEMIVAPNQSAPVRYTEAEIDVIKATHFKDLQDHQIQYALKKAERMGLDFFSGQVVAWPGKQGRVEVYTTIQGLRSKAEETSVYFPGKEATFQHAENGALIAATAYVKRWDQRTNAWIELSETSMMAEYASNTGAWQTHKHVMLAKTAEARLLRRVFPQLKDLYIAEERGTEEDRDANVAADRQAARDAKLSKITPPPAALELKQEPDAQPEIVAPGALTPTGVAELVAKLSKPKRIVLFRKLQMEEPADYGMLTSEQVDLILKVARELGA